MAKHVGPMAVVDCAASALRILPVWTVNVSPEPIASRIVRVGCAAMMAAGENVAYVPT